MHQNPLPHALSHEYLELITLVTQIEGVVRIEEGGCPCSKNVNRRGRIEEVGHYLNTLKTITMTSMLHKNQGNKKCSNVINIF